MEENKYFIYKKKDYITYDSRTKRKIPIIFKVINEISNSEKNVLFPKLKKKNCLFSCYLYQRTSFVRVNLSFSI